MITSKRMAAVDRNAAALGVPPKQLMESAGNAVARTVRRVADPGASVAVFAGRGNNGGDALVAVRYLDAYDVSVSLLGRPESITTEVARENWEALRAAEYDRQTVTDSSDVTLDDPDVVVDGMLGTGVTGALREPAAAVARAVNASDATVVAVDVPSGVDADTGEAAGVAVEADHVVTFHDTKPGLGTLDAAVTVADIGIPDAAELFVGPGDLLSLSRRSDSHKGDHGEVLVVGGGPYTGAPALAAQAALRAGADLVRVACPASVAAEVQGYSENLILRPFPGERLTPDAVDHVLELAADHDVLLLGPGLGDDAETLAAVRELLAGYGGRGVVDADALQVVPDASTDADLVCTPHRGELRAMGGPEATDWRERRRLVAEYAAELGQTLLVKGAYDVVADAGGARVNRTGNPGMTVGGTGDVLAGAVAGLAASRDPAHDLREAAAIAAYATGRAGDAAADAIGGYGLCATDLLSRLPRALWGERDV
jgi:NAD(P)H-hydrate epimerase